MARTDTLSSIPHPPKKPIVGNMLSVDANAPVQHPARNNQPRQRRLPSR